MKNHLRCQQSLLEHVRLYLSSVNLDRLLTFRIGEMYWHGVAASSDGCWWPVSPIAVLNIGADELERHVQIICESYVTTVIRHCDWSIAGTNAWLSRAM